MAVRTEPGRLERAFGIVGMLLTTGAILDMARAKAGETSGGDLDPSGDPIKQAIFLAIYALALVLFIRRSGVVSVLRFSPLVWTVVGVAVCSTMWSVDPGLTLRRAMALCGTTGFGTYLGVTYRPARLLQMIAAMLGLAAALSLVAGVLLPQIAITSDGHSPSWNGIYQQKNMLGEYMALAAFVFALRYRESVRKRVASRGWLVAISAALGLLLLSTSKSSLISAFVSFSCFPLVRLLSAARRRSPSLLVGSSSVLLAAAGTGALVAWKYFTPITLALGRDPTLTGRTYVWHAVVDAITVHPWLGYGYSAFWGGIDSPAAGVWAQTSSLMLGLHVTHAHNGWLDLLLQIGVVGVAVYLVMMFKLVKWTLRKAMRPHTSGGEMFAVGYCLSLLVSNMVESKTLDQNSFAWVMVCALVAQRGVELASLKRRERGRTRENVVRPDPRIFPIRTTPFAAHQVLDDLA